MDSQRWLLTATGQTLHLPDSATSRDNFPSFIMSLDGFVLSPDRTNDHDNTFGVDTHPHCKTCERLSANE